MAWIGHCRCLLTVCMHYAQYPWGPHTPSWQQNSTNKSTRQRWSNYITKTQIKAAGIKQLDLSVTGGVSGKKKSPQAQCNCFHVSRDQKHSQGYLLLHLYDQMPSNVCFLRDRSLSIYMKTIIQNRSKLCVTAWSPVRKSHVAFNWDKNQQTVAVPRANVGKDMHFGRRMSVFSAVPQ